MLVKPIKFIRELKEKLIKRLKSIKKPKIKKEKLS